MHLTSNYILPVDLHYLPCIYDVYLYSNYLTNKL